MVVLRARRHFCFIQTSLFGVGSSFCVGDSKKKNLITKDKKNQPKAQERELRFSTVFCTRERICISAKRAAIAKLSLVLLRLFFFRRSVLFHHKDRCILERVLFFSDLAGLFFSTSSSSKKRRGKFFFGLSQRLGCNKCPSSELCSHVHERL